MNKQQLASKIWESANKMRSKIEANEYKDYILGFIFYKFLSETEVARLKAGDFAEEDLPSLAATSRFLMFATPSPPLAAISTLPSSASSTASSTRCRLASPSWVPMRAASPRPLATSSTSSRTSRWTVARTMMCSASSTSTS